MLLPLTQYASTVFPSAMPLSVRSGYEPISQPAVIPRHDNYALRHPSRAVRSDGGLLEEYNPSRAAYRDER